MTAEGDKVTLSTNTAFQGTGVKYNARGVAEGQALTLRSNSVEGSFVSEKQIIIEGDLNEQEIQDIKKIVNQANGLREDVATGDLNTILANSQQIKTTGSIASVDLNIKHSESVSVQQASYRQKIEQSAYPSGAINNDEPAPGGSSTSPLVFLRGLLHSLGNQPPKSEGSNNNEKAASSQLLPNQTPVENTPTSLPQQIKNTTNQTVQGLHEFLDKISEKILKGAKKIARLANALNEKVERQADKFAQAYEKLSEVLANGNERKANRLQNKIDHRIDRLEDTTEKFGSRIEQATNKLTKLLDQLAGRLTPSASSASETPLSQVSEPTAPSTQAEPQTEIKTTAEV